ncbi:unnamed protein product [Penicillium olsonii]|uniref:NodB homology domain-containing protein n=1 Tax=Penicillium olsonii TaxID=99116 RepID=A0A9W4HUS2_PENOL|nr:unnamed protein product [Penicillium olsonii]
MASSVSRGPKLTNLLLCCFIGIFIPFTLASHHGPSGVSDDPKMESRAKPTQPKRVLCGYGIDLDAVSLWANTGDGTSANPSDISRGIYGATVGVDRVLSFLDRHHIKATCGLHGFTHEHMSALNASQEEEILSVSLDKLSKFLGKKPSGWTAPAWTPSPHTVQLLEKYGLEYDHSFMHHDSQMYKLPYVPTVKATDVTKSPSTWMQPMSELRASSIVEIPANWHLDDWPAFNVGNGGNGYIDTDLIFKMWTEQFDFYYQEYDSFVFPITIHPQVSGKPHVLRMHERLLKHINSYEGVEWMTMVEMSNLYKSGQIPGHVVEGGAAL